MLGVDDLTNLLNSPGLQKESEFDDAGGQSHKKKPTENKPGKC